ncbi:MAG: histidine phosphatase family protein [Acidobacteriaceae bacterium]|nr:histidine phosphatase family protein [Acidobacteriaceae bacterium]
MSEIIFIRHGETDMAGSFCGHSNPALNSDGENQAKRVAEEIASLGIERLYSSDLLRASQTALAIGQRVGIQVKTRSNLREIFFGQWEGLQWNEIEKLFPQDAEQWLREFPLRTAPEGESYLNFTHRIDSILQQLICEAEERRTAIVTHRGVMRYALTKFFGFPEDDVWPMTASYGATIVAPLSLRPLEIASTT